MNETERVGITPKSWTAQRHRGVLHLGKRWYVVTADIEEAGIASERAARHSSPHRRPSASKRQAGNTRLPPSLWLPFLLCSLFVVLCIRLIRIPSSSP